MLLSPDGSRAYVSEHREGTVAVVDARSGAVLTRWAVGERPAGVALTPDGSLLVAAASWAGEVVLLETDTGRVRAKVPLRGLPWAVAVSPDGALAWVTVSQLDELAAVDLRSARVIRRVPVGRRPEAVDVSRDGTTVAVANTAGGTVTLINAETAEVEATVRLKGVNVRGIAVTADGAEAYTTCMPPFNTRPAADPREVWHNLIQAVAIRGADSAPAEDQWLDFARTPAETGGTGSPDPFDLVTDAEGRHAWFSVAGRDVLTRITIRDRRRDAIWPISQVEAPVGANPRGIALSPDGKQVWVANHLGNSLTVVDAVSMRPVRTIDLGPATAPDPTLAGQLLFHGSQVTRGRRFTCSSCHPDGRSDGLTWRFVHVQDGFPRRNSRDLRGGIGSTTPFRWSGHDARLDHFLRDEIVGLLGGPTPTRMQLEQLERAVEAMDYPPNPYRSADGSLTPLAREGEEIFRYQAGCSGCHSGPRLGGTGVRAWVGTTPESHPADVPHLLRVHDSPPYLHDGRAATLAEVFSSSAGPHGDGFSRLTPPERAALLRYLQEL